MGKDQDLVRPPTSSVRRLSPSQGMDARDQPGQGAWGCKIRWKTPTGAAPQFSRDRPALARERRFDLTPERLRLPRGFAAEGQRRVEGEEAHDRARRQRPPRQEPQRLPLRLKTKPARRLSTLKQGLAEIDREGGLCPEAGSLPHPTERQQGWAVSRHFLSRFTVV